MMRNPKTGSRSINSPFPNPPAGLGFVNGDLFFNAAAVPNQSHTAGQEFEVRWFADGGGSLQVFHTSEPERVLWGTVTGKPFVSAALGRDSFEESRGSFAIHDKVEILCSHQTVEEVTLAWPSEAFSKFSPGCSATNWFSLSQHKRAGLQHSQCAISEDADGTRTGNRGPCVIVTGCLYSDPGLAREQMATLASGQVCPGPFYMAPGNSKREKRSCLPSFSEDHRVGLRYWLVFYETREHQLGFSVSLDEPARFESMPMPTYVGNRTGVVVPVDHACTEFQRQRIMMERTHSSHFLSSEGQFHQLSMPDRRQRLLRSEALGSATPLGVRRFQLDGEVPQLKKASRRKSVSVGDFRTYSLFEKCLATGSSSLLSDLENSTISNLKRQHVQLPRFNRIQITYSTSKDERFFGFGEQFSHFDMKGRRVPVLVQEQGLGRGDQPITALANMVSNRSGGSWHTTYAPVPYYMTSKMRSLYLECYEYSVFDLRQQDTVQVQVHAGYIKGRILHGTTPAEIIERYTAATGRMRELPGWILKGAIVGMQGGTESVRKIWQQLKDLEVPLAAFWLQDWMGQRKTSIGWQLWWNWEVDRDHYRGWEQLVKDFRSQGIRTMAYCNPMLAPSHEKLNRKRDLLEEACSQNYVVGDHFGAPYMIPNTSFDAAIMDLTNPDSRTWLKGILREMVKTGVSGWMADFGEALPLDASLHSEEDPRTVHNMYPELWAELNREFAEEWETEQTELRRKRALETQVTEEENSVESDDEDEEKLVFFMRAGYRGSPKWSTLFWEGDQMVSWQRHDGIKSAVTGLLTGGLCGYSLNHSDIGGYCTVDIPLVRYRRTQELLLRWMELNAFSTIFRTHEGNAPGANSQFYSNDTTLAHFARFAKVYKAWEFYRRLLVKEAAATGLPVVRHLFLHYPHDQHVLKITYEQFLVGREFLVVPVLNKGHRRVRAYFPRGDKQEAWEHVWTGDVFKSNSGLRAWIDAPIGRPAVFIRRGSSIGNRFRENLISEGVW